MKVILNSKALWILMEKERGNENEDGEFEIVVEGNKFHFNGISELDIESKEDARMTISKKQFKSLRKILRAMQEQPVVLFDQGNSLMISNIYI